MASLFKTVTLFVLILAIIFPIDSYASKLPINHIKLNRTNEKDAGLADILSANKGKVIYLDFWASWCTPCRKSFPWMNKVQSTFDSTKFTVISINVDQEKKLATEFLKQIPANFPVVYDPDGKAAKTYGIKGMPSSYLINRHGNIVKSHTGFFTKKIKEYENEITQLISHNDTSKLTEDK
jgi:thiol-disulfide isomerase/thioredoxin